MEQLDTIFETVSELGGRSVLERLRAINARGRCIPIRPGFTEIGFGSSLMRKRKEEYIVIPDSSRRSHFGCMGATNTGKTRLIESGIEQDIRKGFSAVYIDPKGDNECFSKICQVAAECGRLDEVMLMTLVFPDLSIALDPLADYYMEEELIQHVTAGIESKEVFYTGVANEVTQVIVAGLIRLVKSRGGGQPINYADIKHRLGYSDLEQFKETLRAIPGTEEICDSIEKICSGPGVAEHFAKISTTLRVMLSALTFGNVGQIVGKARTNEFIKRLREGKSVILVAQLGVMLAKEPAKIIGRILMSMILSLVGRMLASSKRLDPTLCIHIDEGDHVLYPGIQQVFNKVRAANVWLNFYTQSTSQMIDAIGPQLTQSIIDNIATWLFFRVNHPDTCAYVEKMSPLMRFPEPGAMLTDQQRFSLNWPERPVVRAHKVIRLPDRVFYLKTGTDWYKGKTLDASPSYLTIQFPEVDKTGKLENASPLPPQSAIREIPPPSVGPPS